MDTCNIVCTASWDRMAVCNGPFRVTLIGLTPWFLVGLTSHVSVSVQVLSTL